MRKIFLVAATLLALVIGGLSQRAVAQSDMISGLVLKIDESASKITMKHGPIKKFDLEEGHSMVFRAQDPAMLKSVKVGDKVNFEVDRINGQFTVTKLQKAM